MHIFFFFQAEDGIRYLTVTGVQTCALPIYSVVASGIFVVPAAMAAAVGTYAPLAVIACAVAMGAIVICFAAGGRRIATSGGPYGYIRSAFGPLAGCAAGTMLWVSNVLACGAIAAALGDVIASLGPHALAATVRVVIALGTLALVAAGEIRGGGGGGAAVRLRPAAGGHPPLRVFCGWGAPR